MIGTIRVLMPYAEQNQDVIGKAPRLDTLEGKTVGFLNNGIWASTKTTFEQFELGLRERYGIAGAKHLGIPSLGANRDDLQALAEQVDAAVVALAN